MREYDYSCPAVGSHSVVGGFRCQARLQTGSDGHLTVLGAIPNVPAPKGSDSVVTLKAGAAIPATPAGLVAGAINKSITIQGKERDTLDDKNKNKRNVDEDRKR